MIDLRTFWNAATRRCVRPRLAFVFAFVALTPLVGTAAEWQWSVPLASGRAFLWIPPACDRVRAVVVGQNNMLEQGILEHAALRRTLAALGIAEVWLVPPFDNVFQFDRGAGERFDAVMRSLGDVSGYDELASAPFIPIGHSACASYPWNFAAWNPSRTLAILSIKGDAPQTGLTGSGRPNPDWGNRNIDGIPALMVMSEIEWWDARLAPALGYRASHPAAPISLLADVGHSHFDASDQLIDYLALFIRKAAAARLGAANAANNELRPVDPARGWLMDRWRGEQPLRARAAPAVDYAGDRADAFWYFDAEMSAATEAYYAAGRGKQAQQVDFVQDGQPAPISSSHAGVELKFAPLDDGITFHVSGTFIDPLPAKPPVAAKDAPPPTVIVSPHFAPADTHAAGDVEISRIYGPVAKLDANTFRVALDRAASANDRRTSDIWLLASHPGDARYKSAVQQAVIHLPRNTTGGDQTIDFPAIPAQSEKLLHAAASASLKLAARSSAGVPVCYYVREGPAEIEGNTLRFTAIPSRAKFPITITVVACQAGRSTEPKLKAATPVEQSFRIER
jgi:hypothetical protein